MKSVSIVILVVLITTVVILGLLFYSLDKESKFIKRKNNSESKHPHTNSIIERTLDPNENILSREEGLQNLTELITGPPAQNCEDVMLFMRTFRDNRDKWQVTRTDLNRIYRRTQPNIFKQLKQFALSRRCAQPHGGMSRFLD